MSRRRDVVLTDDTGAHTPAAPVTPHAMDAESNHLDSPDPDGSGPNGAGASPPTIEAPDGRTADVMEADGFGPDGQGLERYRTILQNIRDYAIYAVDPEGYITEWTEGAQKVKGYTPSEVVGQHFRMFHTPEDRAAGWPERFLAEAGRNGRAERESWHVRKGGGRFWANEIATAIRDHDGRLTGFTKISRDLTIQKVLERQQEESLTREREAREAAEAFMAVMSHELRTPVTTIYGTASLLTRDPDRADTRDLLADIEEEAERLVRIVDDLLVLSRVERGVVLLTPEPVLLRHVLTDVLAIVRRRYPSAQIEVQGSVPTPVLADATAVRQILHNLLTNAAKYAGRDGPIVLRLMETERWVEISILDSGPGLGDQPEDLFQLFYRSPHSARLASGTGIGLYVARQLVRAMGGSIDASTRPEGGASFVVRLPASRDTDDL